MIKLENVSTNELIKNNKEIWREESWNAYKVLVRNNIKDYKQLKEFLETTHPDLDIEGVRYYLSWELTFMERRINHANQLGKEPKLFTFDETIDDKRISITDERNKGKVLLTSSPLILHSGIEAIRKLSISEIKHCLSHINSNSLRSEILNFIKIKEQEKLLNAIRFYDEQVIRQSLETEESDINLFFLNKKAKTEIVESQLTEIATYIVDTAKECIWGRLTNVQKKQIISAILTNQDQKTRGSLINAISNYTTLKELEQGILKEQEIPEIINGTIKTKTKKPIDRFIVI